MRRTARRMLASMLLSTTAACGGSGALQRSDGIDVSTLPSSEVADYALFAQRCSKCHSLARPLESGIDDDKFWEAYVAKMRRMPGSGISPDDTVGILRFLHYFSETERDAKAHPPKTGAADDAGATPEGGPIR